MDSIKYLEGSVWKFELKPTQNKLTKPIRLQMIKIQIGKDCRRNLGLDLKSSIWKSKLRIIEKEFGNPNK